MRGWCCVCMGAIPERSEHVKTAKITYYAREEAAVVQAEVVVRVVPSHG